jgi:hypothetical protein
VAFSFFSPCLVLLSGSMYSWSREVSKLTSPC